MRHLQQKRTIRQTGIKGLAWCIWGVSLNTFGYLYLVVLSESLKCLNCRLVCGVLQVADGSHLTFDETQLQPGTLNSQGVENTRLLKKFVEVQQVILNNYTTFWMCSNLQLS